MIKIEENQKSEAQIRLEKKLERDKEKLQEQVKKDQKKIEELKRKAKSIIGEMFSEYLPDYYCFESSELKEIVDTAMTQEAVTDKITEIRSRSDASSSAEEGHTQRYIRQKSSKINKYRAMQQPTMTCRYRVGGSFFVLTNFGETIIIMLVNCI